MGRFHIWLTSRICSIHSQVVDFQHTCCIVLHCCFSAVGRCTKSRRIRREKYAAAGVTYVLYVKLSLVKAYPSQTTAQVGEVSPSIYHNIYIYYIYTGYYSLHLTTTKQHNSYCTLYSNVVCAYWTNSCFNFELLVFCATIETMVHQAAVSSLHIVDGVRLKLW